MNDDRELAERVAAAARQHQVRVAVAESLTGGMLASRLAAATAAADWFRGAVVAYSRDVKHQLLGVPPGPVVSEAAALAMAAGVAELLGAGLSVAVTGVGGPEPQDEQPPGTVWVAVHYGGHQHAELHHFDEPDATAICERTCTQGLHCLLEALDPSRR